MNLAYVLLSILFLIFNSISQANEKVQVYVGFWEKEGIRKAFEYKEGQWKSSLLNVDNSEALKSAAVLYTSPSKWNLFFDGKTYGNISTKSFGTYTSYKENGLQKITSKKPLLTFRKIDDKFSDWNGKIIRPILVCNSSDISDPDHWKPAAAKKVQPSIYNNLKKRMKGKIYFCKNETCEGDSSNRDLKDNEVSSSYAYRDANGNELQAISLKFSSKVYAYCEIEGDGCKGEGPFWYLVKPSGDIQFLTKAAALIESADLNHDGSSELLFWLNEYNTNGYELIDGKTLKSYKSSWSYH